MEKPKTKSFTLYYEVEVDGVKIKDQYLTFAERIDQAISKAREAIKAKHNVKFVTFFNYK